MTTRDYSDKQEKHIAKVTGGKVQSNSGGTKFGGGDVHTDKFFIEAKTPAIERKSFTIMKDWLEKMKEQAFEQGKEEAKEKLKHIMEQIDDITWTGWVIKSAIKEWEEI